MDALPIKTRFAWRALVAACALALSCALLLSGAGRVGAERTAAGNLVVSLSGTLSPRVLPRAQPAPISLGLSSDFSTSDGTPLPSLRRIEISLGNRGRLQDRGLPACRPRLIRATTLAAARAACGVARVGYGYLAGYLDLSGGKQVDFKAALLAVNSRQRGGERAILADVHSTKPPMSFLMKFVLHRSPHSVHLVAKLPAQISRWVRITHFELHLHRVYVHAGRTYSYLSAVCSLPRKLTSIVFPLATVTYGFANREVTVATVRACQARG
jgi:hypothetical protein